jgi:hypothetical protein
MSLSNKGEWWWAGCAETGTVIEEGVWRCAVNACATCVEGEVGGTGGAWLVG